jgi:hypothetical protein
VIETVKTKKKWMQWSASVLCGCAFLFLAYLLT